MSQAVATHPAGPDAQPVPRERGWRLLLPALAAFLLVPALPVVRTLLPVEQTILLLTPALAACALAGWWAGGRLSFAVVWCALAGWMLAHPAVFGAPGYDRLMRGWSLVLAATAGLTLIGAARGATFTPRALGAVGGAFAVAALALLLSGTAPSRVAAVVDAEVLRRHEAQLAGVRARWASPEGEQLAARLGSTGADLAGWQAETLGPVAEVARHGAPALLALESLAALALAWSLYHRLSRVRIGPPLAPLAEFRFNDQLVWGLVVGLTLTLLPTLAGLRGVGLNLVAFFGALYALRGAGVLAWLLRPGRTAKIILAALALPLWPAYAVGAFVFGVGDTWINWRSRGPRPTS